MGKYKCVLLDWDGTLINTLPIWIQGYKELFAKYNVFPTDTEIADKVFGNPLACIEYGISDYKTFNENLFLYVLKNYKYSPLYPYAKELLSQLLEMGVKIVLITSTRRQLVEETLNFYEISGFFNETITRDDVKNLKPDPEGVYLAVSKVGGDLGSTLIVGDSGRDIIAAKNAGIDSVLFVPEENRALYGDEYLAKLNPTFVIKDLREVLDIVKGD